MRRATTVIEKGHGSGEPAADRVRLDLDHRHRRRLVLTTAGGESILLDLAAPAHLKDGDCLRLEDGGLIAIEAALEPLVEITAPDTSELVRVAFHLGNRHLPAQIVGDALRIRRDHVIEEMVAHLGATCTHIEAPFDPEGGAYDGLDLGAGHAHHHHDHGHHHHDHGHVHE
jgi:urease accessory protein